MIDAPSSNDAATLGLLSALFFIGTGACAVWIVKLALVDGLLDFAEGVFVLLAFLLAGGMILSSGNVWLIGLWSVAAGVASFVVPLLGGRMGKKTLKRLHDDDLAKYQRAIAFDPRNYSAHRNLADAYAKSGLYDEAIAEYKEAIKLNPPDMKPLQRRLNETLDLQAGRVSQKVICHECEAEVPPGKVCSQCGARMNMSFAEWISQPETMRDILRGSVVPMLVGVALLAVFSALPLEVKAVVLMASLLVGGFYFLRSFGT